MADPRVNPNIVLPRNVAMVRPVPEKPGFWKKVGDVGAKILQPLTFYRPVLKWGRYAIASANNPSDALQKIDDLAAKGLARAAIQDVKPDQKSLLIQGELDQLLEARKAAKEEAAKRPEVGPIAEIPGLPIDPQVTRAPDLQARVDATDWEFEMEKNRNDLCDKLSVFTTLIQMRERCGIMQKNNLTLMGLVNRATETQGEKPSVWKLFTETFKDLSFFQTLKAAWFYWIYYQSSLIPNTVEEYVKAFIKELTKDLVDETSPTRKLVFKALLVNANQFLLDDLKATKEFAYEQVEGDLEQARNRAIETHMGKSLEAICKAFSEKWVKTEFTVPFFATFQKIPLIGYFFKGFQWLINRFIIQSYMKYSILPDVLETGVKKGLEATQPHNLPFAISLTQFFTEQLKKLQKAEGGGEKNNSQINGITDLLRPVITHLKEAIALEPHQTPRDLRKAIEKRDKWFHWSLFSYPDQKVEEGIEQSIIKGGNLLFNYLNEAAKSGELFANLLKLSAKPFSGEFKDERALAVEYRDEQLKFGRVAREVVKDVVSKGVAKAVNGDHPEEIEKVGKEALEDRKAITNYAIGELAGLCKNMSRKIEESANAPTPENNVQADIASIFQIMQVFANRQEIQDQIETLKPVDRDPIWRIITPLYEKAAKIEEHLLTLQDIQHKYPMHASVATHLASIQEILASMRNQFHAQPRHYQNPLIHSLNRSAEEVTKGIGKDADVPMILNGYMTEISALSERIAREQKVIDALYAIYPPREDGAQVAQEGHLDQLINYERGVHQPGFTPRHCIAQIRSSLDQFPEDEKRELEDLIGKGSNLQSKWDMLEEILQRIYDKHMAVKTQLKDALNPKLDQASFWVKAKAAYYSKMKDGDHREMQKEMKTISAEAAALLRDLEKAQPSFPATLTPLASKIGGGLVSAGFGALGAYFGLGPIGTAAVSALGGIGSSLLGGRNQDSSEPAIGGPLLKTGIGLLAGGASLYHEKLAGYVGGKAAEYLSHAYAPYVGGWLGGAVAGWNTTQTALSAIQRRATNRVMDLFNNSYKYILKPRIWKAATIRTMKALSE